MEAAALSDYINVINQKRLHIGMTIRSLARRANMDDDLLGKNAARQKKDDGLRTYQTICRARLDP